VPAPAHFTGRPFAGPAPAARELVFLSRDRMDERHDMSRAVTDGRWLYLRHFRPDVPYVEPLEYMFRARGYQSWARTAAAGGLTAASARYWGVKPAEELYDLEQDPDNVASLAADPAHAATRDRLRAALRGLMVGHFDNGLLPEGSSLEGWEASRRPGAFPVAEVLDLAWRAGDRDAANLPAFLAALDDAHEARRWWAAQGCTLLGSAAEPARDALRRRLDDASPSVRVAAAEALLRLDEMDPAAVGALWAVLQRNPPDYAAVQAANVLLRRRGAASGRAADVDALHAQFRGYEQQPDPRHYLGRALGRLRQELGDPSARLVYPSAKP
ncbi:MAG: HEAT repeat domain-containing protein, partial [Limisphaerales bacterium]